MCSCCLGTLLLKVWETFKELWRIGEVRRWRTQQRVRAVITAKGRWADHQEDVCRFTL